MDALVPRYKAGMDNRFLRTGRAGQLVFPGAEYVELSTPGSSCLGVVINAFYIKYTFFPIDGLHAEQVKGPLLTSFLWPGVKFAASVLSCLSMFPVNDPTNELDRAIRMGWVIAVKSWREEVGLNRAMDLLLRTDKSIGQIAKETGYTHLAKFIIAFRRRFRESPSFLRR